MPIQLTVTAKGQVTLRRAVLEHLKVRSGQKLSVSLLPDGRIEMRAEGAGRDIRELRGILRRPRQQVLSVADMQRTVEQAAVERSGVP